MNGAIAPCEGCGYTEGHHVECVETETDAHRAYRHWVGDGYRCENSGAEWLIFLAGWNARHNAKRRNWDANEEAIP